MYPRLNSSQDSNFQLQEGQEQVITPIHSQPKEEPKEINIKDYVDMQDNNVVVFVINWIKKEFMSELMEYLNKDFKQSMLEEIKKQTCN